MPWDEVGSSAKINPRDKYFFAQTTKMNPREIVFLQFYMNCSPCKAGFPLKNYFARNFAFKQFDLVSLNFLRKKLKMFQLFFNFSRNTTIENGPVLFRAK